ncbi:MAG: PAS domain S-box protein, partial [Bacteroidia bacterium]|nr:PAS domain S-box protein [Methylotenera sp.]
MSNTPNLTDQNAFRLDCDVYAAVFNAAGDAIIATDLSGCVTHLNAVAEKLTGWHPARAVGQSIEKIFDVIDGKTRQPIKPPKFESLALSTINPSLNRATLIASDGHEYMVTGTYSPIRSRDDVVLGTLLVFRDATDQVGTQAALIESEQMFRATFENASVGIVHLSHDGRLLRVNQQYARLLGYSLPELLLTHYQKFTHPDDLAANEAGYERLLAGEIDSFRMEKRYIRKDQSILWVDLEVGCVRYANQEINYFISVVNDITERKKIEQVLQIRTEQLEQLINASPFGIFLVDQDFRILQVNPYALPAFGHTPHLIGRDFGEVMHMIWLSDKANEVNKIFRLTLETGESSVVEEMIEQRVDSKEMGYYAWQIHRIPLSNNTNGVVCYFQDISQRVLAQHKIRDSEWRLCYAADSAKLTFVEIDLATGNAYTPQNFAAVMGYVPPIEQESNGAIGVQTLLDHVVPDDRPNVELALTQFFNGQPIGKIDYRVLGDDQIERWIESKWSVELGVDDKPVKSFATNLDITDRKRAEIAKSIIEERYHTLFNSIEEGFCILEKVETAVGGQMDFRYIEANPAFELQAGIPNVAGKTIRQVFPNKSEDWYLTYDTIIKTGKPVRFKRELLPEKRMLELYAFRVEDNTQLRVAVIFKDVTQRKQYEEKL